MLQSELDTLITYNPWTLSTATPLAEAARLLVETGQTDWPVVSDDGDILGLLSCEELAQALEAGCGTVHTVERYVNRAARFVDQASCPLDALERMLEEGVRMLPVVDQRHVVGTLATADFLRELSYGESRAARQPVMDFARRASDSLDADLMLPEAMLLLSQSKAPHLPVVQGDFPIGVVSRRLLQRTYTQELARKLVGERPHNRTLGQLLQTLPMLHPGATLGDAAQQMIEHQLDALAIANQAANLLGIITESDILQAILDHER